MPREECHDGEDEARDRVAGEGAVGELGVEAVQLTRDVVSQDGAGRGEDDGESGARTIVVGTEDEQEEGAEPEERADEHGREIEGELSGELVRRLAEGRDKRAEVDADLEGTERCDERDDRYGHAGHELGATPVSGTREKVKSWTHGCEATRAGRLLEVGEGAENLA